MPTLPFKQHQPKIEPSDFLAPDAWIIGDVSLGAEVSIFFGVVLRGDINPISVGRGSNIQEHALLHTSNGLGPCIVEEDVTVGHRAIIHGAHVKSRCIIGMGSTILDQAVIEEDCIIGANSLVTMKTVIPAGHLALGSPAKPVRKLSPEEIRSIADSAAHYRKLGNHYRGTNWSQL
ncbi:MAG: gamma carbonic anhydrase family protein [Oligoflexia bacterium]|nr:gamma carbonic anhydrase family protein [Oligoflexia bacterium]